MIVLVVNSLEFGNYYFRLLVATCNLVHDVEQARIQKVLSEGSPTLTTFFLFFS